MVRNAIVATEDKNFFQHGGIDVRRTVSALVANLQQGGYAQGGSTLTQQLARAIFLSPQKTISRKVNEALVAFEIERRYSKDQILTMYANEIYLGHGNYGVEAACRYYFGKSVKDVTLAEAALLAGHRPAPGGPVAVSQSRARAGPPLHGPAADAGRRPHHRGRALRGRSRAAAGGALAGGVHRRAVLLRGGPPVPREDVRRKGPLPARPAGRVHARPRDAGVVRGGAGLGPSPDFAPPRFSQAAQPDGRGLPLSRVLRRPILGGHPRRGGADPARRRDGGRGLGGGSPHRPGDAPAVERRRRVDRRSLRREDPAGRRPRHGDGPARQGRRTGARPRPGPARAGRRRHPRERERRDPSHGRRLRLDAVQVQPRIAGAAPGGFRVQALRLSDGSRAGLHGRRHGVRRPALDRDRSAAAPVPSRQLRRQVPRHRDVSTRARALLQHPGGSRGRDGRALEHHRDGPPARHPAEPRALPVDAARRLRGQPRRADLGVRRLRQPGPRVPALHDRADHGFQRRPPRADAPGRAGSREPAGRVPAAADAQGRHAARHRRRARPP